MIRTNAVPRPIRSAAALVGVAGMLTLAGCATTESSATDATTPTTGSTAGSATPGAGTDTSAESSSGSTYADGTYTASGSYQTPESVEDISVTLTLADDVITAVEVKGNPQARESQQYQSQFIGGISDEVVGKKVDDISVSRVAGSSLTSGGFNKAVEEIKSEAKA